MRARRRSARCRTVPVHDTSLLPPTHPTPPCCCSKVIALCPLNVASFCDVTASNTNFGDPCVNKAKTLTFNYE
jgi:hypothetical protein